MTSAFALLPRWLVPIEPAERVLHDHALVVEDGKIGSLLPRDELETRHPGIERIDLAEHVLLPGLVNAHTHAAMTLMRGLADDLPLMTWLREHIWPSEAKHVNAEFVRDGTLLACVEMLRGGTTCFNDMYFFPEAAIEAAATVGMRASIGMIVIEFPSAWASDAEDYLRKGLALREQHRESANLSFCFAPHAPYTVADASLARIAALAAELDLPVHIHLHETEEEIRQSLAEHRCRPLERISRLGLLGPHLIAVHAVHLERSEIDALGRQGASVAHCPASNLKLASGFAPIRALADAGTNIALGTDGAASNNRLDVFSEMRLAALLAKAVSNDAGSLPAHAALRAATLGGARALGLEARIGSLEPGKAADLVAVRLSGPELAPCFDPASQLVYAAGREHVSDVWVAGEQRLRDGELLDLSRIGLNGRIQLWQNRLSKR